MDSSLLSKEIESIITASNEKICSRYSSVIKQSIDSSTDEDADLKKYLELLLEVTTYGFRLDDYHNPFIPRIIMDGKRTVIPSDLNSDQLDMLKVIYSSTDDHEMKARIADVLWVAAKEHKYALNAIEHYLESAHQIEDWSSWTHCYKRIRRALQLSLIIGRKTMKPEKVYTFIDGWIIRIDGQDPLYLTGKLIELLIQNKVPVSSKYIEIVEKRILNSISSDEYEMARYYIGVKSRLYKGIGKNELSENEIIRLSKSFEMQAEKILCEDNSSYIQVVHLYEEALKVLRKIPGKQEEVTRILRVLPEYKKLMKENFKEFTHEFDASPILENITAEISGRPFIDAVIKLAYYQSFDTVDNLRKSVIDLQNQAPLSMLCSSDLVNEKGQRIISMPNGFSRSKDEEDESLKANMYRTAAQNHSFAGSIFVNYGLKIINNEHRYEVKDLDCIVLDNAFVPDDRVITYKRGLHAGLSGDYLTAAYILAPQLENSFRLFANLCGDIVTTFDDNGKEQVKSLNEIFELKEFSSSYDPDILFNLKSLFTEKYGTNLRNKIAHGLLNDEAAASGSSAYLWWVSLRLCCMYSKYINEYINTNIEILKSKPFEEEN